MKYIPACPPVGLMINGEYKVNDFCDQVQQGKRRIEITEMAKKY